ncbi:MAG: 3-methyl-2-oxobutanoate hydroxymethyltransferase [Actinobacteria bacterium ATB1]|nr:3-methyl-2-oxobutanoate hydroxymethyltransferase [Actinobacteria bacterium ATB1]
MSTYPDPTPTSSRDDRKKVSVPAVKAAKGSGTPLVMTTAYDAATARIADLGGADMILVGDSLGMVVLGREDTLKVTLDEMVHHTKAVTSQNPKALVVGDMPFLSYHVSREETVRNAGRLIQEGGAECVKIEGGRKRLRMIGALLDAEIPVMGHIGLTPQSVNAMGGFKVQGKVLEQAEALLGDAAALAEAGVFAIVLEGVPAELAGIITQDVDVPTIGIGAGAACDGQVLVIHDLLGLTSGHVPKFVRQYADLGTQAVQAMTAFAEDVRTGAFPSREESYALPEDVAGALGTLVSD